MKRKINRSSSHDYGDSFNITIDGFNYGGLFLPKMSLSEREKIIDTLRWKLLTIAQDFYNKGWKEKREEIRKVLEL